MVDTSTHISKKCRFCVCVCVCVCEIQVQNIVVSKKDIKLIVFQVLLFNYVHMSVWVCACKHRCSEAGGADPLIVTGSCEPPNMNTGK